MGLCDDKAFLKKLNKLPMFRLFKDDHIKGMLELSTIREYCRFEPIFKEGQYDNHIFILLSGLVNVVKNDEVISTLRRTGDIFGEERYASSTVP